MDRSGSYPRRDVSWDERAAVRRIQFGPPDLITVTDPCRPCGRVGALHQRPAQRWQRSGAAGLFQMMPPLPRQLDENPISREP